MAYISVNDLKTRLAITEASANRDTLLTALISTAEKIIEKHCNVETFEAVSTTWKYNSEWVYNDWLFLPVYRVGSITSIATYDQDSDNAIDETFASDEWYLDRNKILNKFGTIRSKEIRVVYTPVTIPNDIVTACALLVQRMFNESNYGRGNFDLTTKDVMEESVQSFATTKIPRDVELILKQYKRYEC